MEKKLNSPAVLSTRRKFLATGAGTAFGAGLLASVN
jgi:branched-chain amino acid transport system substrate-binding protein